MDVQRTTDSLKGYFLIATPVIESGFFKGTVTYVCEHGEAGAMGIVINKPLDLQLADVFEHLNIQPLLSHDEVSVMAGGPIKVDRGFVLHSPGISYDATLKVNQDVWLTTSKDVLADIAGGKGPDQHLVALGYAGWSAGQLEQEIAENSWLTIDADTTVLFETPTDEKSASAGKLLGID
ncbi:MAG: YqgE/AlgH family protein, partial [Luminiphilus sp.]